MAKIWLFLSLALIALWQVPQSALAGCVVETTGSYSEGDPLRNDTCNTDGSRNVYNTGLGAGEDLLATGANTSGVTVTENRSLSSGQKTADAQIKASPGYVSHMICLGTDAAATGGTIILHDATTETGTQVFVLNVVNLSDYHLMPPLYINTVFANGIYLGYTTVTDVNCTVFYR